MFPAKIPANKFPLVYLISEGAATEGNFIDYSARFLEIVRAAVKARISVVQIREKKLSARNVFELTKRAAEITQQSQTLLLVNDRADVALAANANGVHLAANSLPAKIIRQNFPENFIVGVSAHSLAEVESAKIAGADFATFSPIFATPSKAKYGTPQGSEKLKEVCSTVKDFPVLALGGINETNFQTVLQAGASGFAAIRFLNNAENLSKIVNKLRNE